MSDPAVAVSEQQMSMIEPSSSESTGAAGEPVIRVRGLRKHYGAKVAVDGIHLSVEAGEIVGLLGPNGAGKTTTILMLLGLTEATSGSIEVCGFDPMHNPLEVKRTVAYLPDSVGFYDQLSARENLRYIGRLAGIASNELEPRMDEALERVRLSAVARNRVGTFSRGMQQRLGIAEVLIKRARVAILDEPTNGLDPQSTYELLEMIRTLKSDGIAVLLSSHILDRVQAVCDRVALFHQGRIELEGSVESLAAQVLGASHGVHVQSSPDGPVAQCLTEIAGVKSVVADAPGLFRVLAESDVRDLIARTLVARDLPVLRLDRIEPSLDEIYRRHFAGAQHEQA